VLDRFGDFVSDQVVAPVREMVSQTLASLLIHMPRRSVLHVHSILLQMIKQDFAIPAHTTTKKKSKNANLEADQKAHVWEVRHAGLLGIKYEVAVRSDLFEADYIKKEIKQEDSIKQEEIEFDDDGKAILRDVVDAAVLGYVFCYPPLIRD
jgi:TATA-binding protein-associated factor